MAHHSAVYNPPSLQFGFKKSDVTEKQVAGRFDRAARFFRGINLQRTTTTRHVLLPKGLAT